MGTKYQGTFQSNKRPVITVAPDCLVYINGELSLPSGGNPGRRIDIQPLITSVSVQAGVEQSPGTCQIGMQIPTHYLDDFFRGGHLVLTTMMEVRVYMKGHFLVGGAPRYYPVFWGVTTSVSQSWSGGVQTVDLSCQDMVYWLTIQRINDGASLLGMSQARQGDMNRMGSGVFTDTNPFNIIYSLLRYSYGDAMNASIFLGQRHKRSEPTGAEDYSLMAYWTRRWGRISHALRMYGPKGDVLQGDLLAGVLNETNREAAGLTQVGTSAQRQRGQAYEPYKMGDIDLTQISPFSIDPDSLYSFDIWTSDFKTKKEIADTTKKVINYEFFQDFTGEIIFKPPFYNLDVMPNKPVSWIRPVDVINDNMTETPPDVTFIEGTASGKANWKLNFDEVLKTKATYVDYRLVQKYGWKPGNFNSEFIGAGLTNASPRILFFHLVDELDRQNVRIHNGSVTIPLRPELRLGYPVYVQHKDAYFYVDSIAHQFSYAGQCTSSLTLSARRTKFYGAFPYWKTEKGGAPDYEGTTQPPPGQVADPGVYPTNLFNRPLDPLTGNPVGDCNVILTTIPRDRDNPLNPETRTSEEQDIDSPVQEVVRDLVSFRTQFDMTTDMDYVYQIDPERDNPDKTAGVTQIRIKTEKQEGGGGGGSYQTSIQFPVSDERGYEVIGSYGYGRDISLKGDTLLFVDAGDQRARELLKIAPEHVGAGPPEGGDPEKTSLASGTAVDVQRDATFMTDPNNYGRRLTEIQPTGPYSYNNIYSARNLPLKKGEPLSPEASPAGLEARPSTRQYGHSENVARWQRDGALEEARQIAGVGPDQYPDDVLLAFIQVESAGDPSARRRNKNGKFSEYCGLLQIGHSNAKDVGQARNTDFLGNDNNDREAGVRSLVHFIQYQERYKDRHNYDPEGMAIMWKAGPGTASQYNKKVREGASEEELKQFLRSKWNADVYVDRFQRSRGVWNSTPYSTSPPPSGGFEGLTPDFESPEINEVGFLPEGEDPFLEADTSTRLYRDALKGPGTNVLPANFNPVRDVRDEGLMPVINDFLRKIYEQAYAEESALEKELRGESRQVLVERNRAVSTAVPSPHPHPHQESVVDTPLGREEVQKALEDGKSPSEVFGYGGEWHEVQERVEHFKQTLEETFKGEEDT